MTTSSVRVEHKYLLTHQQYYSLRIVLSQIFPSPEQVYKTYPVCSLYFDTPELEYFFQKINGEYRHTKIRLRKYSKDFYDDSAIWLETKTKIEDRITKRRQQFLLDAKKLFSPEAWPLDIREDLFRERALHELRPSCFIYYEREAFESFFSNKKLRVTFDSKIASYSLRERFSDKKDLFSSEDSKRILMEIKYQDDQYPLFLKELLQNFSLSRVYFSKYAQGLNRLRNIT